MLQIMADFRTWGLRLRVTGNEDGSGRKDIFNHEFSVVVGMTTGYILGKVMARDIETCISELEGSTSDPASSPVLEFHGHNLKCWLSRISEVFQGAPISKEGRTFIRWFL